MEIFINKNLRKSLSLIIIYNFQIKNKIVLIEFKNRKHITLIKL